MYPEDIQLGPVLLERRPATSAIAVLAGAALVFLFFGVVLTTSGFDQQQDAQEKLETFVHGCAFTLGSFLLGIAALSVYKTVLRIHKHGVSKRNLFGTRRVRYEELDSISFRKERQYGERGYVGTQYFFDFGCGGKVFYFITTIKADRDDLEDVRDYVAQIIAQKLAAELEAEGAAPWTSRLRFVRSGVEYLRDKQWQRIPYAELGTCEIDGSLFYLRSKTCEFPLMQEYTIVPNFYPGYALLLERTKAASPYQA